MKFFVCCRKTGHFSQCTIKILFRERMVFLSQTFARIHVDNINNMHILVAKSIEYSFATYEKKFKSKSMRFRLR